MFGTLPTILVLLHYVIEQVFGRLSGMLSLGAAATGQAPPLLSLHGVQGEAETLLVWPLARRVRP